MSLTSWIGSKLLKWKGQAMLKNLISKLEGYKTYIMAIFGIIVVVVGHFFGPVTIGPIDIPIVDSSLMWKTIWEGLMVIFMRKGISSSK